MIFEEINHRNAGESGLQASLECHGQFIDRRGGFAYTLPAIMSQLTIVYTRTGEASPSGQLSPHLSSGDPLFYFGKKCAFSFKKDEINLL